MKKLFAVLLAVMLLSVSVLAVAEDAQPDLLARIKDLTGGDSLASNIQLVYNNVRLAAAIAAAL